MKALVNYQIAKAFEESSGIEAIPLLPYSRLDAPVSAHADMLFCILDKTVFCYEDYILENKLYDLIRDTGYQVVFVSKLCKDKYPDDISLNVLVIGKVICCNVKYTAPEIIEYALANNYSVVNVKQGYSACSTLVVDDNTVVTSDSGIANALEKSGITALLISNERIILEGYSCGFIGGASCKIREKIYFFGDITELKDNEAIFTLLNDKKLSVCSVLSGRVYDFGGIKLL